ncbi:MAG: hypothetical protein PUF43_07340 [Bacteroidales bacterium]|nr:hypothetical protein [Bacteroidales bacterium]
MKRTIAILAAAVACAAACTKLGIPTIEFASLTGNIYLGTESTPVEIKTNLASESDATASVRISYIGSSLKELASVEQSVTVPAGETSVTLDVPNRPEELAEDEAVTSIKLSFTALPAGYVPGAKAICLLSPSTSEALICSFAYEEADLIESLRIKVSISGSFSGKDWAANGDMSIPVEFNGEGSKYISSDGLVKVLNGENSGTLEIKAKEGIHDLNAPLGISLAGEEGVIAGDVETMLVTVRGIPTIETLGGEWKFVEIVDKEELEFFYMGEGDDLELCPIHNEGFSLSFSSKDGGLVLSPSATGDFANYYRECSISNCKPKNMVAQGVVLGSCSSEEGNMFVTEIYSRPTQEIYYKLPTVNRSFDNSAESLGEGVISLSFLSDDEIIVTIRDYDKPGFGLNWWNGDKFYSDMFGFASLFRRQK